MPAMHHDQFGGLDSMNGFKFKDYSDFATKWNYVTVRYRKDTGEMRLTYANDAAWKTLMSGSIDYPKDAAFAKIGLMTADDPGFTSSLVPSGAQRYQLMVMDKEKFKDTDGWGYALFDENGKTFDGDPTEKSAACHACHKMVPDRGYVFSQPVKLNMGLPFNIKMKIATPEQTVAARVTFETVKVDTLPEKLKKQVPAEFKEVRLLRGEMENAIFYGTIDEIRPTLAVELLRSKLPTALVGKDGKLFSLVIKGQKTECELPDGKKGMPVRGIFTDVVRGEKNPKLFVRDLAFCEPTP
ncbi:MAG: cytochrome P460 family protein [Alphaproteobacteria bacterium]|nr:cytochrome P460 family protein [Alphaproteobacteria bacterium]